MENEIIVVKQLPVIEEQLKTIKKQFEDEAAMALSLECNEDTYKQVKTVRANLTKIFNDLESRRTTVRKAILAPYDAFNLVYKNCITDVYAPAKAQLDAKISEVEDGLKKQKEDEVVAYFKEYLAKTGIDFLNFDDMDIAITLNASKKSLKEKVKSTIDKVSDDLAMIATQEHSAEILVEYKRSLNVSQAILTVNNRIKAIEEEKAKAEAAKAEAEAKAAVIEKVEQAADEFTAPVEIEEPIAAPIPVETPIQDDIDPATAADTVTVYQVSFKIKGSLEQMKALKKFLVEGDYQYEQF